MKEKEIKVFKTNHGDYPQEYTIENTLETMQAAVEGYMASI